MKRGDKRGENKRKTVENIFWIWNYFKWFCNPILLHSWDCFSSVALGFSNFLTWFALSQALFEWVYGIWLKAWLFWLFALLLLALCPLHKLANQDVWAINLNVLGTKGVSTSWLWNWWLSFAVWNQCCLSRLFCQKYSPSETFIIMLSPSETCVMVNSFGSYYYNLCCPFTVSLMWLLYFVSSN